MENALTLILALIGQLQRASGVIKTARAEGRDVTEAEVDQVFAAMDQSRADAVAAVEEARST